MLLGKSGMSKRGRGGRGRGQVKGTRCKSSSPIANVVESEATNDDRETPEEPQLATAAGRAEVEGHESGDETDTSSVASSQTTKKRKTVVDLSPEEEQAMVEWLEAHPIFYNKKLHSYKEVAKKERMWTEKANEMGKPVLVLKTWYTSLRSRFGRLRKKRSGDEDAELTERDEWILRHFDFLRPHVHEVQKRPTVSMKQKLAATCVDSPIVEEVDDDTDQGPKPVLSTITRPTQQVPTASSTPRLRTQKQILEAEEVLLTGIEKRGNQMMSIQQKLLEQLKPNADRERDAFIDWVRSVIHELDHGLSRRCQREMSNTLYRYIGENDQLKKHQVPTEPTPTTSSQVRPSSSQPLQGASQACSSVWQPLPPQWPTQPTSSVSVWQSQDPKWVAQQFPQQSPQQQQHTLTQLQPIQPTCVWPNFSPVPMMTGESMTGRPVTASATQAGQEDTSKNSQSSFHLSDYINVSDPDPGTRTAT